MKKIKAWAVFADGEIDLRGIEKTKREAMMRGKLFCSQMFYSVGYGPGRVDHSAYAVRPITISIQSKKTEREKA